MYDPSRSYEDNYREGPFPQWCFGRSQWEGSDHNECSGFPEVRYLGEPRFRFLGRPVHVPLGIPAGPLLGSRHVVAAWRAGVSVCTYKTVRSQLWPSHPHPNVLEIKAGDEPLVPSVPPPQVVASALLRSQVRDPAVRRSLSISNSFGVPSRSPGDWQLDVRAARRLLDPQSRGGSGAPSHESGSCEDWGHRLLVLSFQGSRGAAEGKFGFDDFVQDTICTQSLAAAEADVLELNLSCPNERGTPLFTDIKGTLKLLEALRKERPPAVKLIIKIGSLSLDQVSELVTHSKGMIDGISAINTISAQISDSAGGIVLGSGDQVGGICGHMINRESMAMLSRIAEARERAGIDKDSLGIVFVGGVTDVAGFLAAQAAGADHVQAATAFMWSFDLAAEVADALGVEFRRRVVPFVEDVPAGGN